jgi:hypothetical protein
VKTLLVGVRFSPFPLWRSCFCHLTIILWHSSPVFACFISVLGKTAKQDRQTLLRQGSPWMRLYALLADFINPLYKIEHSANGALWMLMGFTPASTPLLLFLI